MGIRTTPELVAGVIEVDDFYNLDPFISAASTLVDRIRDYSDASEPKTLQDGYNSGDKTRDEKLTEIETYLAAHFYTLIDPRPSSEGVGGGAVATTYQNKVDLRLFTSHYGQMAAVLDESGYLERLAKGKMPGSSGQRKVGVTWLGKSRSEQYSEGF